MYFYTEINLNKSREKSGISLLQIYQTKLFVFTYSFFLFYVTCLIYFINTFFYFTFVKNKFILLI